MLRFAKVLCLCIVLLTLGPKVAYAALAVPVRLTLLAGPIGGDWYALGGAVGEVVKKSIPGALVTVSTGGGIANVLQVNANTAEIGLSQSMLYSAALKEEEPYVSKKVVNVTGLAYIQYLYQSFFLVKEDTPVNSIDELIEKKYPLRIVLGVAGTTPELAARRLFAEYGVTYKDIESWGGKLYFSSFAEAQTLMADGHVEAYIGPVLGAINQMISMTKMKLLPWKEGALDAMVSKYAYLKKILPKNRYYFVTRDLPFMGEANVLVIHKNVPDDVVYNIVRGIEENADMIRESGATYRSFNPAEMASDVGGPLHPGAAKYYKEKGYLK